MTEHEKTTISGLGLNVTYLPGSFDKRFARDMYAILKNNPNYELTEKQRKYIFIMLKRYRRQIPSTFQYCHPDNVNK